MGVLQAAEKFITNKPKKSKEVGDIISHIMSKNPSFVKLEDGTEEDGKKNVDYWLYWNEEKFGIYAKENTEGNNNVALPYENGPLSDNESKNKCNMIAFIFDNTLYLVDRRKLLAYINEEIKANPGFLRITNNIKWVLIMKHMFIGLSEFGYKQK